MKQWIIRICISSHFQRLVEICITIIKPSKELNLISYSYIESKSHVEVNQAIIGG